MSETAIPLYLVYSSTGPGHYDYAVVKQSLQTVTEEKGIKCFCGRIPNFKGISCSTDKHGHCRCPCATAKLACGELCVCKHCNNVNEQRPTPSQTRRKSHDNQRLQLRGMSGVEYMLSLNEEISTGSMSVLEIMVIQTIIMYSILNSVDCTSEAVYQTYSNIIFDVSKLCTIDLPLFDRNVRLTANYLKGIHVLIDLSC